MTEPTQPTDPFAGAPLAGQPPAGAPFAGAPAGSQPGESPFGGAPTPYGAALAAPTPVVPVTTRRRSTSAMFVNLLLGVAVVVAVGGVAFAAGRATAPATTAASGRNGFGGNGGSFGPNASGAPGRDGFGGAGGGISLSGTVTAVSADSITLQLASGQSITIPTSAQTTYHSQTAATASDVTSGSDVIVQLSGGGRFVNGGGQAAGNGGANGGGQNPPASGAPVRGVGSASSITIVPKGS